MNQLFDNLDRRPDHYDIEVVHHQPWQLGIFHPDLIGKFLWYPNAGTLVFEGERGFQRIGEKGDFPGRKDTTEYVYDEIMRKIIDQQNG